MKSTTDRTGSAMTRGLTFLPYALYLVLATTDLIVVQDPQRPLLNLLAQGLLAVLGLVFSIVVARHPALSRAERRPWRYVAAALVLQIASTIAYGLSVGGGPVSLPFVLGSLLRLLLLLVLLRALIIFAGSRRHSRKQRVQLGLDAATVVGGGAMLTWYFLVGPALPLESTEASSRWPLVLTFAVADLVLVFGISVVLLRGTTTSARVPMLLLLGSGITNLILDLLITYAELNQPQAVLPLLRLGLPVPVMLMASAAIEQYRRAFLPRRRLTPQVIGRPTWLPYVALGIGLLVLIWATAREPVYPWWGLVAGATVITVAVAVRQIIALRENHLLAVTDHLTGLAGRTFLLDRVRQLHEQDARPRFAILVIDLDGFKQINDVYGHEVGDAYLVAFADVLRRGIRRDDLAARIGGDEFAVLLVGDSDESTTVAERISVEAAHPTEIGRHVLPIRASIGIYVAASGEDLGVDQIMRRADQAMYAAKRRGSHGWQLYGAGLMEDEGDVVRRLVHDPALTEQLELAYQPIVALATGDLVGIEALVRWRHPSRGLLMPQEFIPLAEDARVVHNIGMWVVDRAARQLAIWRRRLGPDKLFLAVNLSPQQLARTTLAAELLTTLERNGIHARDLVAEVAESAMVEDGAAIRQLEILRREGVRIALDDFGTGYSSLRYLTRLPVDVLKLDRTFVQELDGTPRGSAVAVAVIRLAQILQLDTIAEGVEEEHQATELRLHGYRNGQGYWYSRPVTPSEIDAIIGSARGARPAT